MRTLLPLLLVLQAQTDPVGSTPHTPRLPLAFVANEGQWKDTVLFRAESGPLRVDCSNDALLLDLRAADGRRAALRLGFSGAARRVTGEERQPAVRHYFAGPDRARWRTGVASFGSIRYEGVAEGIGLRLREASGRIEYDLLLEPGADISQFALRCEGASALRLEPDGALMIDTAAGPLRQTPPRSWQIGPDGRQIPLPSAFRIVNTRTFGWELRGADPALPTVVDPGLDWSTFLGGSLGDFVGDAARTAQGEWVLAGFTASVDFPVTPGAYEVSHGGGADGFVARISADGSQLLWATFLGGTGYDEVFRVRLDSAGRPVLLGYTESADFPTTVGAWDRVLSGLEDSFVARLSADGGSLEWSTYLGGQYYDEFFGLALAAGDEPVLAGGTESPDFPVVGSAAAGMSGFPGADAALCRLSADGAQLLMSTCLRGQAPGRAFEDFAGFVEILPGGAHAVVLGDTSASDFPVTAGAFDTSYGGNEDEFLAVVDLVTGGIAHCTFLGGAQEDEGTGLAVGPGGEVYAASWTASPDFPVAPGAFDVSYNGDGDVAVTVLSATLAGSGPGVPLRGTFLGTSLSDDGASIALAPDGRVLLAGATEGADFPVTPGAWDTVHNGGLDDVFVARFDPALQALEYGTFLGGTGPELPAALRIAGPDAVLVCGATASANFPARGGGHDPAFNGVFDGFVARLSLLPCPILEIQPDPLVRGQAASFRVTELIPGERAYVAVSLAGTGFGIAPPQLGGLNLDLAGSPTLVGLTPPANAGGSAILGIVVPAGAPAATAWFQAAVPRGAGGASSVKSNVVERDVT